MKQEILDEWKSLLQQEKTSPYLFRTRLERLLKYTDIYAKRTNNSILKQKIIETYSRLRYISDQSNQTSDGTLNSFLVLKEDFAEITNLID